MVAQRRSRGAELDFWSGLQRQQLCAEHPGWAAVWGQNVCARGKKKPTLLGNTAVDKSA